MDQAIETRLDNVVEDDVRRGFVNKPLPIDVTLALKGARELDKTLPAIEYVKLRRPTPRMRRMIAEAVIAIYHRDLKNPALLSNEQLRKLNTERGEWSEERQKRMEELQEQTNNRMRELYAEGFDQRDAWSTEILDLSQAYIKAIEDTEKTDEHAPLSTEEIVEAKARFDRWLAWSPEAQPSYTERFAALQGLEQYSPDRDQQWLLDHSPSIEAAESIQTLDDLRDKLRRYVQLIDMRGELLELQQRNARIFAESVEQRREAAEQLARIYYCTEISDDKGVAKGPLAKNVDGMYDLPQELIDWLVVENYFFHNGIPEEARSFLEQWGFVGTHQLGSSEPSGESPEAVSSKPAGVPAGVTPPSSSAPTPTTSMTPSSPSSTGSAGTSPSTK